MRKPAWRRTQRTLMYKRLCKLLNWLKPRSTNSTSNSSKNNKTKALNMAAATNKTMQNPVFRAVMGLVFLVSTYFCAATVYIQASVHDYAGAGVMLAITGLAILTAFRILPLGKILDSWAFLIFIEIVLFLTGGLSLASIYWAIKGGNYLI